MKKKEKKYYGKKKKFYSFFLKIFIPFIIVTSILGGIITAFLNLTFQNNISSNVQAAEKTIRQAGIKYWNIYQTELDLRPLLPTASAMHSWAVWFPCWLTL